jgi:hypothetical protein
VSDKSHPFLDVSISKLQEWFEQANAGHQPEGLKTWRVTFGSTYAKWERGQTLSEAESEFLARSFTALYDTPVAIIDFARELNLNIDPLLDEIKAKLDRQLELDLESAITAKNRLDRAFEEQLREAQLARLDSLAQRADTLRAFNRAVLDLKKAVKRHSATPPNRAQEYPEVDRLIHLMRRQGKTYPEIQNVLNAAALSKMTAKQIERQHKRYRDRSTLMLLQWFRPVFREP